MKLKKCHSNVGWSYDKDCDYNITNYMIPNYQRDFTNKLVNTPNLK